MTITLSALQKQRTDTAANWTSANPTLLSGELGFESDTGKVKLGTGSTAWNSLGYLGVIPSSGTYPLSQLLLPSGTAAAPSLAFAGNTGIYSPGADQVSVSTGGTGRLFVDSSGNVGVGTSDTANAFLTVTNQDVSLRLNPVTGAASITAVQTGVAFRDLTIGSNQTIFQTAATERLRLTSTGEFEFTGAGSAGTTEAVYFSGSAPVNSLVIDSTGKVGLGSSSPVNLLQVRQATPASVPAAGSSGHHFAVGDTAFGLAAGGLNNGNAYLQATRWDGTAANYNLLLQPNGGSVGIGSSSPSSVFHARLPGTTTASIATFDRSDGAVSSDIHYDGTDGRITFGTTTNHPLSFKTNNTRAITIDSSQRVGIGTTTVNTTLEVFNSSTPIIRVGDGTRHMELRGGSTTQNAAIGTNYAGGFDIIQNGSAAVTIDSSKRVLVGTSSQSGGALFQVNGDRIRIATAKTPASASDTGTTGEICWDASYIYVCTATNTWKRAALSTW